MKNFDILKAVKAYQNIFMGTTLVYYFLLVELMKFFVAFSEHVKLMNFILFFGLIYMIIYHYRQRCRHTIILTYYHAIYNACTQQSSCKSWNRFRWCYFAHNSFRQFLFSKTSVFVFQAMTQIKVLSIFGTIKKS